ncbi:2OG-Fe(II) oxygenase [Martelella mangrovi]|uniref:2OG-Fe(II) oxygenase n=1 Tax=Martelella mangrovi TaxID=1397477 RepID=A0ABV2IAW2_9HYPH
MTDVHDKCIRKYLKNSFLNAQEGNEPYRYWLAKDMFPETLLSDLQKLDFPRRDHEGRSGTREIHNKSRHYFDRENRAKHGSCAAVAAAFQSLDMAGVIQRTFGTNIEGANLRIEYAQDMDGFWLEPHTDIGVKLFTLLIYLSDGPGHEELGTDIYASKDEHVGRSPFGPNLAMAFVPADNTWHGFQRRPIEGVRKSLIINYVAPEWRAREQLAFPDDTIRIA